MRAICLTLSALLLGAAAALAQQGAPQPAAPAVDPRLKAVLDNWEKAMSGLTSFKAACTRTTLDKALNTADVYEGSALFRKAANDKDRSRASLELFNKKQKDVFEKYVCTGTYLYEYAPANKVIRVHDLPAPKPGQVGDENFLQFLFGMKSADALQRYQMEYVPGPKEHAKHWHYIRILPKLAQDKADFSEAQLTLSANSYLPRRLWYHQPNGNEITWDFAQVDTKAQIPLALFDPPQRLPTGWRMERVAQQARNMPPPPKTYRPQDR